MTEVRYESNQRNGYSAVDLYKDGRVVRTVISGVTRKVADTFAGELNQAYENGQDAVREAGG